MLAQPGVGALVDVLAGVHGGRELVAGRAAALVRAGQVDALRQPAARRARLPALVHVAAQVGRVVVLVAGMIKLLQNACAGEPIAVGAGKFSNGGRGSAGTASD